MKNIMINGEKLKALLTEKTGKTLAQISTENSYSDRFLPVACKRGIASPNVVILARHYGIEPAEYEIKPEVDEADPKQITIDDLEVIRHSELKALVIEAVKEVMSDLTCKELAVSYDELRDLYTVVLKIKKEIIR